MVAQEIRAGIVAIWYRFGSSISLGSESPVHILQCQACLFCFGIVALVLVPNTRELTLSILCKSSFPTEKQGCSAVRLQYK